jgi:hypothetical protein
MILPRFQRWLNPRRMRYPFLLGAAMWVPWLMSVVFGPGDMDLAGHPVGADFLQFYAAGHALRTGHSAQLYDLPFQWQLQRQIIGPESNLLYGFITPPHLAWLYVPFSALPFGFAFSLWSALGIVFLWASFRLLGARDSWPFVWSLTWYVVFTAISYGQNSLLTLFLLAGCYWLWRRQRFFVAGIALSLLMYKPQLTIGVAVLWLLEPRRHRRALLGLMIGTGLTASLAFLLLPEASASYMTFARTVLPVLPRWLGFPLWNLHTVRGFWQLLLPGAPLVADGLSVAMAVGGLVAFVFFWRQQRDNRPLLFGGAICLTWWLTPHAMIYDLVILLIPAYLLWQEVPEARGDWRAVFGVVWLTTLLSAPVDFVQGLALPLMVQITVPVLLVCLYWTWRRLSVRPMEVSVPSQGLR